MSASAHQDSPKAPETRWPLKLIRRGSKVGSDRTDYVWWQELPTDTTAESVSSVGYEVVEVISVSALLSDEAVLAGARRQHPLFSSYTPNAQKAALFDSLTTIQAAIEQVRGGQGG